MQYGQDGQGSIDLQTSQKAKRIEMSHEEVSSHKSSFKSSIKKRKLKKKRIPPADKDEVLNRNNIALEKSLPGQKIVMAHPQLTFHEQQIIEKHGPGPYRQYLFDQVGNFDHSLSIEESQSRSLKKMRASSQHGPRLMNISQQESSPKPFAAQTNSDENVSAFQD